ncbi:peptidyl-prolyl cis-trans isomerase G isoform X3 [Gracilaria domingensis]|nr:peptidyl-prolyl cis-trans isomerase G isoform X3 [Gracilaria domingensis]
MSSSAPSQPSQAEPTATDPYVIYQLRKPSQRGTAVIPRFVPNTHAPAFSPANYRFARVWATDASTPLFQAPRSFEFAPSLGSESSMWSDTSSYLSLSTLRTAPSERPSLLHATQQPIFLPRRASLTHSNSPSDYDTAQHFRYPPALSESVDEDAVVDDLLSSMNTPQFPQLRNTSSAMLRTKAPIPTHHHSSHRSNVRSSRAVREHHPHRPLFGSFLPSMTKKRRSLWQWLFCSDTTARSVAVPSVSNSHATRENVQAAPASNRRAATPRVRNIADSVHSKQTGSRSHTHSFERSIRSSTDKHHNTRSSWNFLAKSILSRERSKSRDRRASGNGRRREGPKITKHTTSTKEVKAEAQRANKNRIVFQRPATKTSNAEKHASAHAAKRKDNHHGKSHTLMTDSSKNSSTRPHRPRSEKSDDRPRPDQSHSDRSRSDRNRSDRSSAGRSSSKSTRSRNEQTKHEKRKEDRPRADRPRVVDRPKEVSPRKDRPRRTGLQQLPDNVLHSAMNKANIPSIIDQAASGAKAHGTMQRMPSADSADQVTSRISSDLSSSTYGRGSRSDSGPSPLLHKANPMSVSSQEMDPNANVIGSDVSSFVSGALEKNSPVPYANYRPPLSSTNAPHSKMNGGVRNGPEPYRPMSPRFPGVSLKNGALVKDSQQTTCLTESTNLPVRFSKKGTSTADGMSVPYSSLDPTGSIAPHRSFTQPAAGTLSQHSSFVYDAEHDLDTASTGLTSLADESVSTHKSVSTRISVLNEDFPFVVETDANAPDEHYVPAARGVEYRSPGPSDGLRSRKPIFQNSALVLNAGVSPSYGSSSASPRYHSDWSHPHATAIDVFCQCSCACVYEEECRRKCELVYERSPSVSSSSRSRQGYRGFKSLPPAIHSSGMKLRQGIRQDGNSSQEFSEPRVMEEVTAREANARRTILRANQLDELPDLYTSQFKTNGTLYPNPSVITESVPYAQARETWQEISGASSLHQGPPSRNVRHTNASQKRQQPAHAKMGNEMGFSSSILINANQVSGLKPPSRRRYSNNSSSHHSCDSDGCRKSHHAKRRERHSLEVQGQIARRKAGNVGFDQTVSVRSGSHSYPRSAHLSQIKAL